jgi:hypothetical protein
MVEVYVAGHGGDVLPVPITSENITVTKQIEYRENIRSDRCVNKWSEVSYTSSAQIDFHLTLNHDWLFEHALGGDWQNGAYSSSLQYSNAIKPLVIGKHLSDLDHWEVCTDAYLDTLSLDVSYGNIVNGSATFVSNGHSFENEFSSTPTIEHQPVITSKDVGVIEVEGYDTGMFIESLDMVISNSYQQRTPIGNKYVSGWTPTKFTVTGNMSIYLTQESLSLYRENFETKTFSLRWWLHANDTIYEFFLPECVLDITTPVAEGLDTDMFVNVSYFAIYSETFGGVMQINKWRDMSLVDIAANSLWPKA